MPPFHEGQETSCDYEISPSVFEAFLMAFGDRNALHVDAAYAQSRGFKAPVMHGAILNGFLSHFVGMHFPADNAILLSTEIRFLKPSFLGDKISLQAKVTHYSSAEQALQLQVNFINQTQSYSAARAKVMVGFLNG